MKNERQYIPIDDKRINELLEQTRHEIEEAEALKKDTLKSKYKTDTPFTDYYHIT